MNIRRPIAFVVLGLSLLGPLTAANAQDRATPDAGADRQQQLEQARAQMDKARRELEAAAREVAELSGDLNRRFVGRFNVAAGGARLGANIEDADGGALVIGVTPGSGAADAGLKIGDIIVAIDGIDLSGGEAARKILDHLGDVDPGAEVGVTISRGGARQALTIETRESDAYFFVGGPGFPGVAGVPGVPGAPGAPVGPGTVRVWTGTGPEGMPFVRGFATTFPSRWRDMELVPLTEGLGSYFGTSDGLLVVHAPENDEIGLMDGDVILEIGARKPTSPEHAMRILVSFEPGETLRLQIMRHSRRQTLEYVLPEE